MNSRESIDRRIIGISLFILRLDEVRVYPVLRFWRNDQLIGFESVAEYDYH